MDILEIFENQINLVVVSLIAILALIDLIFKRDLKSQIVSLGVLGTFIGIFMGLQDFDPNNMKNSINTILIGLKTAFFTSIVGMGTAIFLSIIQKFSKKYIEVNRTSEDILKDISNKLNSLDELNRLVEKLDIKREIKEVIVSIDSLKDSISLENRELITILNSNFQKMNSSLEIAIEQLSKGATEEIIQALKQVIQEFNKQLQIQFGENFVELNRAVINLLKWQENYKEYIEKYERSLKLALFSIEKSKSSLETIASRNQEIQQVYKELQKIINTYDMQIEELNKHLKTYALLSSRAEKMFNSVETNTSLISDSFKSLSQTILTTNKKLSSDIKLMVSDILKSIENIRDGYRLNEKEINLIIKHFKTMESEIPKALAISLENLNRGLTSLTIQFQKDYEEIMNRYKIGLER